MEKASFLKINPADSVVVCLRAMKAGEIISADGKEITLLQDVPAGHKVLIEDKNEGEDIIKYGYPIGHCEERNDKAGILAEAGVTDTDAVNRLLNQEIKCAIARGMKVLYCIGEKSEEQEQWQEVLGKQLEIGLKDVDTSKVVIAYEPIWSIGPGKTPADKEYITKIARFVKEKTNGMDIVYGGGLKQDNAEMLASIDEIDGGLIALTRFQGEIGYYPEEYLEIIRLYMGKVNNK